VPGADQTILQQLAACGLVPDAPPVWQSQRSALYAQALEQLVAAQLAYPCACSRKDIEAALQSSGLHKPRHGELVYPGTCRQGLHGRAARAWRLHTGRWPTLPPNSVPNQALAPGNIAQTAINFIATPTLAHRPPPGPTAPGWARGQRLCAAPRRWPWAYQLAVVVDDARGKPTWWPDTPTTPRQILLRVPWPAHPRYLHTPLVLGTNGEKLSKQNGARPLDLDDPLAALQSAATALDLPTSHASTCQQALHDWVAAWAARFPLNN
jgi:glutamyl-Q tRNA(Asp) synthetase